jgi:signal transduction histidine kinase
VSWNVDFLSALLQGTQAEGGWLDWGDGTQPVIVQQAGRVSVVADLARFPASPETVTRAVPGIVGNQWSAWCENSGKGACAVAPVRAAGHPVGTLGIYASSPERIGEHDVLLLDAASIAAGQGWLAEARVDGLRRRIEEARRMLDSAVPIGATISPRGWDALVATVAECVDVTYGRLAVLDSDHWLGIRASGGHRAPLRLANHRRSLSELPRCAAVFADRRIRILELDGQERRPDAECQWLFGPKASLGIIAPFTVGAGVQGLLLLGEERRTRVEPFEGERLAVLEVAISRVRDQLGVHQALRRERKSARKQGLRTSVARERSKMALELHDHVGQGLNTLLLRIRMAQAVGAVTVEELGSLERTTRSALDATRAIAYDLRRDSMKDPLEDARKFSYTITSAAGCTLLWRDERSDQSIDPRVAEVLGAVIKESMTNVIRHADATMVNVRLSSPDGQARVSVEDNGIGFVARSISKQQTGLGLLSNRERLGEIGGSFSVQSTPGQGALVMFEAPRVIRRRSAPAWRSDDSSRQLVRAQPMEIQ